MDLKYFSHDSTLKSLSSDFKVEIIRKGTMDYFEKNIGIEIFADKTRRNSMEQRR